MGTPSGCEGLLRHDQRAAASTAVSQARRRARRQGVQQQHRGGGPAHRGHLRSSRSPPRCSPARRSWSTRGSPPSAGSSTWSGGIGGEPEGEPLRTDRLVLVLRLRGPGLPWLVVRPRPTRSASSATPFPSRRGASTGSRTVRRVRRAGGRRDRAVDQSLQFHQKDLSIQVSKMKDAGVDFVATCMDTGGVITSGQGDEEAATRRGAEPAQRLRPGLPRRVRRPVRGSFVRTDFATFELPEEDQPAGLKTFLRDGRGRCQAQRERDRRVAERRSLRDRPQEGGAGLRPAEAHRRDQLDHRLQADGLVRGGLTTAHTQTSVEELRVLLRSEDSEFVPE